MPAADLGVFVFALNDFALLGKPDLAVDRSGRLGQYRVETGAAAASHRAAASVKQAKPGLAFLEYLDQLPFGLVQRPVRGQVAPVLVAVRIAQHYFLDPRSEEHTSELQSLMRISYAVFCLKKKNK